MGNGNGSDGRITTANNADGTGATGNANGTGTGTATDALRSAASSLLPKTGDTSKLLIWVVLAVACVAIIAGVQMKSRKGNRKKK